MSKKVAIILSGCGGLDGSEIQEVVCSLLAIEQKGFVWTAYALDENQNKVVSHTTLKEGSHKRNMMEESARLVHGKIENIDNLKCAEHDILWFPGGFGAVSSFSDIGEKGAEGTVHPKILQVIEDFYKAEKNIVAICVSPTLVANTLKGKNLELTLGKSDHYAALLEAQGHSAKKIASDQFIFDRKNRLYTTPAYMNEDATCLQVFTALQKVVNTIA